MRVLLVDDDEILGEAIRDHLTAGGMAVTWARTLADAFRHAEACRFPIVVLDLQLPDGSGIDFLKWVRSDASVLPVVMISADTGVSTRLDCLRNGADDFLTKPFDLRELVLRMRRLTTGQMAPKESVACLRGDERAVAPKGGAFARLRSGIRAFARARPVATSLPFVAAAALGGYLSFLQLSGNFHTVIAGELYRSAQPSAAQLETYVRDHGIRTVVNLRGSSQAAWYRDEVATARKLNVTHIDFAMRASRELTPQEADRLVAILRDAPKPILIHCQAGADRTGLVSVIYSQRIAGVAVDKAESQLSIRYGHLGVPYLSAAFAMDRSWERLERHFGLEG